MLRLIGYPVVRNLLPISGKRVSAARTTIFAARAA
jgi:hypothetical protein